MYTAHAKFMRHPLLASLVHCLESGFVLRLTRKSIVENIDMYSMNLPPPLNLCLWMLAPLSDTLSH